MSRQQSGQKTSLGASLRPIVVLVVICAVAGALLGVVHDITAPVAAANSEARSRETYAKLVEGAASFEPVECDVEGCTASLRALDASGSVVAYVFQSEAKGYGGEVPIAVAFDTSGTVLGITTMGNSETPGLGTRIAEPSYTDQYVGLPAEPVDADDIDLISGATISSKAALKAFNIAVEAYKEVQ